jgi:hypothetical protein
MSASIQPVPQGAASRSLFMQWLRNTPLAECWAFWLSRRRGRDLPFKNSIDPVEMPRAILPSLFLYERTAEGRFRCRLAGTRLVTLFQHDFTGRYLDEQLPPVAAADRVRLFSAVLDEARPVVYGGQLAAVNREWMPFRRLLLPVSSDGTARDTVFGMLLAGSAQLAEAETASFEAFASDEDLASPADQA